MVCNPHVLWHLKAELLAEHMEAVRIVGEADMLEDNPGNEDPPVIHIEPIQPIARMWLDKCAGRDEEPSLSMCYI